MAIGFSAGGVTVAVDVDGVAVAAAIAVVCTGDTVETLSGWLPLVTVGKR